jgi:hypothetical protein
VAADFNQDGALDFGVTLIDTSKYPENAVRRMRPRADGSADYTFDSYNGWNAALAIFNGPFSQTSEPAFLAETVGAPIGAVLFYRNASNALMIGKWESTANGITPSGSTYVMH